MVLIGNAKPKLTNEKNLNKFFLYILAISIEIRTFVEFIYIFFNAKLYQVKKLIFHYIYMCEMNTYVVD